MNREEIIEKVNAILSEEFEVSLEKITPEAVIYDTLQLDSLSALELLSVVRYAFGIEIPFAELSKKKTFASLYDYIEEKLK